MKTWCTIAPSMLIGATGLIGSALAADMTGAEIKAFVSGNTIYLETTAASAAGTPGQGVVYLAEDGTGLYRTPTGDMWHGKWTTKGNTFCADWTERPNNPCTRFGARIGLPLETEIPTRPVRQSARSQSRQECNLQKRRALSGHARLLCSAFRPVSRPDLCLL